MTGNREASSFVNSAVSNQPFPKSHQLEPPPECVPASGSQLQPMGHFSVELYQSNYGKAGNREAGSFVNSTVNSHWPGILLAGTTLPGTVPTAGPIHGLWELQELYQAKSWNGLELRLAALWITLYYFVEFFSKEVETS